MYANDVEKILFEQCVPHDKVTDEDRKALYTYDELSNTDTRTGMTDSDIAKIADAVIQRLGTAQQERNNPTPPAPPAPPTPTTQPITTTITNLS